MNMCVYIYAWSGTTDGCKGFEIAALNVKQ